MAQEIQIRIHVLAPVERVFDAMSDHERFIHGTDGTRTKVLRDGQTDRNGLGCLREVRRGPIVRFVEEITEWQRPRTYQYMIREARPPIRHFGGRMSFISNGPGTDVEWTTTFEIPIPVLGALAGPIAKSILVKSFHSFLDAAKRSLEAPVASGSATQ